MRPTQTHESFIHIYSETEQQFYFPISKIVIKSNSISFSMTQLTLHSNSRKLLIRTFPDKIRYFKFKCVHSI